MHLRVHYVVTQPDDAMQSDLYGPYDNEKLVGAALAGLPDVTISTKWGPMIVAGKGIVSDYSPEYCRNVRLCELSASPM